MHIWDVVTLIAATDGLVVEAVPVSTFAAMLEEVMWFGGEVEPTVRAVIEHAERIRSADLSFPIILSSTGIVVDGMHRIARAVLDGHEMIDAVRFVEDPPPDRVEPMP